MNKIWPNNKSHKIYIHDNIIFKFTSKSQTSQQPGINEMVYIDNPQNRKLDNNGDFAFDESSSMQKWKLYGRQFLSMDVMFDALFLQSSSEAKYKLRLPLSALIDYKGFRCIAIAQISIYPQHGPTVGFHYEKYQPLDPELKSTLEKVGEALHLKDNRVVEELRQDRTKQQTQIVRNYVTITEKVPISYFMKIYDQ